MWVYLGDIMVLIVCLLSSGYIAVKATAAAIHFSNGFAENYRLQSSLGNYIGYFEVGFTILWLATALGITVYGIYAASEIWN
jgi:hypothetical protein